MTFTWFIYTDIWPDLGDKPTGRQLTGDAFRSNGRQKYRLYGF